MKTTLKILMALGAVAAIWEMWTLANNEAGDTISATMADVAKRQPFVAFMFGMLGTHLFKEQMPMVTLGSACGLLTWPLIDGQSEEK